MLSKSLQDLGGNTLAAAVAGCCQPVASSAALCDEEQASDNETNPKSGGFWESACGFPKIPSSTHKLTRISLKLS